MVYIHILFNEFKKLFFVYIQNWNSILLALHKYKNYLLFFISYDLIGIAMKYINYYSLKGY
jgi:hypothetical protein